MSVKQFLIAGCIFVASVQALAQPSPVKKPEKSQAEPNKPDAADEAARLRLAVRKLYGDLTFAFQMGQRARIQQLLAELAKVAPGSAENFYFQGLSAHRDGDRIRATQWLRKAVAINPDFDLAWNALGLIMLDAERHEEAASAFLKAEASDSFDPHYPYNVAAAFLALKNFTQCGEHAKRALELKPNFSEASYVRAVCLLESGNAQDSLPFFERAVKDSKNNPEWNADYLRAAEKTQNESLIAKILETGVEAHPAVTRTAAGIYLRYGQYERAFRLFDRVLRGSVVLMSDRMDYIKCARRLGIDARAAWAGLSDADRRALDEFDRSLLFRRNLGGRDSLMNPAK